MEDTGEISVPKHKKKRRYSSMQTYLHSPGTLQPPWSKLHPCLHTAVDTKRFRHQSGQPGIHQYSSNLELLRQGSCHLACLLCVQSRLLFAMFQQLLLPDSYFTKHSPITAKRLCTKSETFIKYSHLKTWYNAGNPKL